MAIETTEVKKEEPSSDDKVKTTLYIRCSTLLKADVANAEAVYTYEIGSTDLTKTATLEEIRKSVEASDRAKKLRPLRICDKSGATVENSLSLKAYIDLNGEKVESDKNTTLNVYFKKTTDDIEAGASLDRLKQQIAGSAKLKEALKHVTGKELSDAEVESLYAATAYQAKSGDLDHAADMSEKNWNVVVRNNALTCGHVVEAFGKRDDPKLQVKAIKRAPHSAFALKPRRFESYEISDSTTEKRADLYIPHWQQADDSYVSVIETDTAMKESLTKSGFTDWDVSASANGKAFGFDFSGSVSFSGSNSTNESLDHSAGQSKLTVSYNFPRVRVVLDEDSITLHEDCVAYLNTITNNSTVEDVFRFQRKFGHFFATDVLLGGRLYATTEKKKSANKSTDDTMSQFLATASASFATPTGAGGSVGGGYEKTEEKHKGLASATSHLAIVWEACGGNTLLANSPPDWCATVGDYHNWRIVKQDSVVPVLDLIDRIGGYGPKIDIIRNILKAKTEADLDKERKRDEERDDEIGTSVPVFFEINLHTYSGTPVSGKPKMTLLNLEGTESAVRRSTMFQKLAAEYLNVVKPTGQLLSQINQEVQRQLSSGTDAQFAPTEGEKEIAEWKTNNEGWINTTTKFCARELNGSIAERIYYDTPYQLFDETGKYKFQLAHFGDGSGNPLTLPKDANNSQIEELLARLHYPISGFVRTRAEWRPSCVMIRTPGVHKKQGIVHDQDEVELVMCHDFKDTYHYQGGLYTHSSSHAGLSGAAIEWTDIKWLRNIWANVNVNVCKLGRVQSEHKPFVPSDKSNMMPIQVPESDQKGNNQSGPGESGVGEQGK